MKAILILALCWTLATIIACRYFRARCQSNDKL